ncbi:hypothetical protein QWZ13_11200 [Reinekea marina]|uniref:hypothetical protein n=1 Tax=Reinekea marina TaxID=1310421 RepID=UPI0025B3AEFE|nr:hypothetical protein [Reinekea marina]MDN3649480.1 hypothetical protein [Reinekea marina]
MLKSSLVWLFYFTYMVKNSGILSNALPSEVSNIVRLLRLISLRAVYSSKVLIAMLRAGRTIPKF